MCTLIAVQLIAQLASAASGRRPHTVLHAPVAFPVERDKTLTLKGGNAQNSPLRTYL